MATRILHGRADAEDVVQEAFGRLARVDVATAGPGRQSADPADRVTLDDEVRLAMVLDRLTPAERTAFVLPARRWMVTAPRA